MVFFLTPCKSSKKFHLIKKQGLDPEILKNYRPVANLSFISKIIEKAIATQIHDHLINKDIVDYFQSAYKTGHSCETALLRVYNDIVTTIGRGNGAMLVLLDLSAAFDTIDHDNLLAPNDTTYKRWSCHSGFKLLCKLCRTSPPPAMGARFTVFWACRPCEPAGWLALLLTKSG